MAVWAVLLRGINVGGHNRVPMADLRAALTDAGFADVTTSLASGNVVVSAPRCDASDVSAIVAERFGLDVAVMVRSAEQLRHAVAANPFPDAVDEPRQLMCAFTSSPVGADVLDGFDHERYAPDRVAVGSGELFAHYPGGMARSRLTNAVLDEVAGGPTTTRNWNTVRKLVELVDRAESAGQTGA